ncbi:DinB family protein [Mucilaginibacter sp. SP1R1]|uniref:DinB family protein n=1 Tax=Mucilaginibacter sp. SP1R1 TaxID=2723091 RepID=UPI001617BF2B|nr:DinB family protein [Mucilaginibacter sp. SP1R1]MBB6148797.1 putative damage-inducible protein DinB [Mucilaginibacter sp. SP1R1]
METTSIHQQVNPIITPQTLADHWQGHRRLTRKTIEAFPDDKLFTYSIGGMRSFAEMTMEIMDISKEGIKGAISGEWKNVTELGYHSGASALKTKDCILQQWDEITEQIDLCWPHISLQRFQETDLAFGAFEGKIIDLLIYFIDNEIHHRAQGFVYLRSLNIEPPAFWNRS